MLCPQPIIQKDSTPKTTKETLRIFTKEMQAINFKELSTGDCHGEQQQSYVPQDLNTCPTVWLRVDRVKKSLEAPYSGPYEVLQRRPKFFVLKLPHGEKSVSVDRLKPAYLTKPPTLPSPQNTLHDTNNSQQPQLHANSHTSPSNSAPENQISPHEPSLPPPQHVNPTLDPPSTEDSPPPTPVTTRSGRRVQFKQRPNYHYY